VVDAADPQRSTKANSEIGKVQSVNNNKLALQIIAVVVHLLAATALVLLFLKTRGMTLFCVVPGVFIGGSSVLARPGRPITVYVAFGVLMGFVFWLSASAVNMRSFLDLVFVLLVVGGAVWFLQVPSWPSASFAAAVALLYLGLSIAEYRHPAESLYFDDAHLRRGALTSIVVLTIGLVYLGLGFAEVSLEGMNKPNRKPRRKVRPPADLDE